MFMRQLGNHRIFTVTKNRNGFADQRQPARLVIDPATLMLKPAPHADPVAVSARSYLSVLGEVEIQSTITLTLGTRRRIVSGNIPHGEIQQITDMIGDIRGVEVNDTDFSISTRMPGSRHYSPTMALALSMTLIGSALQQPVDENLLFVGEIDLKRRIRDVPALLATDIANAIVAGAIRSPARIVCSPGTAGIIAVSAGVPCAACRTLDEAVFVAWPQIR
jgi:predicted ATP-dependent serine protease